MTAFRENSFLPGYFIAREGISTTTISLFGDGPGPGDTFIIFRQNRIHRFKNQGRFTKRPYPRNKPHAAPMNRRLSPTWPAFLFCAAVLTCVHVQRFRLEGARFFFIQRNGPELKNFFCRRAVDDAPKIPIPLQAQPKIRRHAQHARQSQSGVRSHRPPLPDHFVKARV